LNTSEPMDYIIVGQGLAGSCLALQMAYRNKRFIVFDQPKDNHASSVAAGLFNPITGRVLAKTWMADILFPYLTRFYSGAEQFLNRNFFFPKPLYRPFVSIEEQNEWMAKSADPSFAGYIKRVFLSPSLGHVHDPLGGLLVKQSGYLEVDVFVESIREYLTEKNLYREERLDERKLKIGEAGIQYGDLEAGKIILCTGIDILDSPYFSWLPVKPLKGEVLQIKMDPVDYIYNRGVYVVPGRSKNEYTVGATYDFHNRRPEITREGRIELETKLGELIRQPYSIHKQNWGIRPTTIDQKVIAGPHPEWPNIIIFNGLGTKGVSLAPYFSERLTEWMEEGIDLPGEVNIKRFKSLYSNVE